MNRVPRQSSHPSSGEDAGPIGFAEASTARLNLPVLAAIILILILVNGVVLAYRYASSQSRPANTYYEAQIERWQQQLQLNPEDSVVWGTIGGLYEEMGEAAKADRAFAKALEYDPKNVTALLYQSRRARAKGDYDQARALLGQIVDEVPRTGRYLVYYELGEVERAAGDTKAAIAAYEKSTADNGSYFNGYQRLAYLYDQVGESDKALAAAEQANAFTGGSAQDLTALIADLRSRGATTTGVGK